MAHCYNLRATTSLVTAIPPLKSTPIRRRHSPPSFLSRRCSLTVSCSVNPRTHIPFSRILKWQRKNGDGDRGFSSQLRAHETDKRDASVEPTEPSGSFGELLRKSAAEAVGVFIIFASGMTTAIAAPTDLISAAMANGLGVMVMVFAVGQISGAHFNPAVSFAFLSKEMFFMPEIRKKHILKFLFYVVGQLLGALLAAAATTWLTGDIAGALTVPIQSPSRAFLVELIQGFLLMLVATTMSTIHKRPDPSDEVERDWLTPVFIGGAVMFNILLGGRISGGSMNPFRSLAPAILANKYENIWVYLVAPTLGAFLGTWMHTMLKEGTCIFETRKGEKMGWQIEAKGTTN